MLRCKEAKGEQQALTSCGVSLELPVLKCKCLRGEVRVDSASGASAEGGVTCCGLDRGVSAVQVQQALTRPEVSWELHVLRKVQVLTPGRRVPKISTVKRRGYITGRQLDFMFMIVMI